MRDVCRKERMSLGLLRHPSTKKINPEMTPRIDVATSHENQFMDASPFQTVNHAWALRELHILSDGGGWFNMLPWLIAGQEPARISHASGWRRGSARWCR